jgi:hypothetical protein
VPAETRKAKEAFYAGQQHTAKGFMRMAAATLSWCVRCIPGHTCPHLLRAAVTHTTAAQRCPRVACSYPFIPVRTTCPYLFALAARLINARDGAAGAALSILPVQTCSHCCARRLNTLAEHTGVLPAFMQPDTCGRAAYACIHFLDLLVGPGCAKLVVERPEQVSDESVPRLRGLGLPPGPRSRCPRSTTRHR